MLYVKAFINGQWRTFACENIADVEALEDVFGAQGIQYKPASYIKESA